jgi:hypothetical protein
MVRRWLDIVRSTVAYQKSLSSHRRNVFGFWLRYSYWYSLYEKCVAIRTNHHCPERFLRPGEPIIFAKILRNVIVKCVGHCPTLLMASVYLRKASTEKTLDTLQKTTAMNASDKSNVRLNLK